MIPPPPGHSHSACIDDRRVGLVAVGGVLGEADRRQPLDHPVGVGEGHRVPELGVCCGHGLRVPGRAPRGLGGMGTPRAATCSAGSRPGRTSPAPGGPGRRTRSSAATVGQRLVAQLAAGTPRTAPPAGTPSAPARSPPSPAWRAGGGCSRPRRPPSATRSPRVSPASARPTSARGVGRAVARQRRGQRLRHDRQALLEARRRAAARAGRPGRARRPRARAARRPAPPAGTPSSARAPAVVSPSWMPRWVPSWWIAAGAACSPDTVDQRCCARRAVAPAHVQRLPHRQHEGQARRRQPPVHPGRAQRRRRTPPAR